jgi:hypothetical protein
MGAAKATATPAAELALRTSLRFPMSIPSVRNTIVEVVFIKDSGSDISDATCYMDKWTWEIKYVGVGY